MSADFLTEKQLNTIRGKTMAGAATGDEHMDVFRHLDTLVEKLDEFEQDDTFGTEGWRHAFGMPE